MKISFKPREVDLLRDLLGHHIVGPLTQGDKKGDFITA